MASHPNGALGCLGGIVTQLYVFRGRQVHGLSYDEANGIEGADGESSGETDHTIWWLRAAHNEGDVLWDAANAPIAVRGWAD